MIKKIILYFGLGFAFVIGGTLWFSMNIPGDEVRSIPEYAGQLTAVYLFYGTPTFLLIFFAVPYIIKKIRN